MRNNWEIHQISFAMKEKHLSNYIFPLVPQPCPLLTVYPEENISDKFSSPLSLPSNNLSSLGEPALISHSSAGISHSHFTEGAPLVSKGCWGFLRVSEMTGSRSHLRPPPYRSHAPVSEPSTGAPTGLDKPSTGADWRANGLLGKRKYLESITSSLIIHYHGVGSVA